ncbi:MAG: ParB/RepB/Spo0J family partition protein, partial [Nanoarchaeota archaeon]
ETAENIWEYYKHLVEEHSGGEFTVDSLALYKNYWELPARVRQAYCLTELAERVGFSDWVVRMAFHYVNLDPRIKEMVRKQEVAYSFAQEVGRIPDYQEQVDFLLRILRGQRYKDNPNPITNRDLLSPAVTRYLLERNQQHTFAFEPIESGQDRQDTTYRLLEIELEKATKVVGNLGTLLHIDPALQYASPRSGRHGNQTIHELFLRTQPIAQGILSSLETQPSYPQVLDALSRVRKSILDQLFSGVEKRNGNGNNDNTNGSDPLGSAEYRIVPIDLVIPDPTQPRKTYDSGKLQDLAETIKEVGLLSPPLVRPCDEGMYQLVVGHRRTAAARLAGIQELEVLVCELSDKLCREIQYEEDIFEKVVLAERAEKLHGLYQLKRRKAESEGRELSIYQFAREHKSLGASAIVHALLFAGLPKSVRLMHQQGLLHYSAAVAIADEWKRTAEQKVEKEERNDWILDWSIESSLLGYNARILRRKVYDSFHQMTLEDIMPDLLGGVEGKRQGRRQFAAKQVSDALDVFYPVQEVLHKSLPRETMERVVLFTRAFEMTARSMPQSA